MKHYAIEILLLGFLASTVQGDPIQWAVEDGGNGHWYQALVVEDGLSFEEAKQQATIHGGNLASITSSGETNFINNIVNDSGLWTHDPNGCLCNGPWIGGYREAEGSWEWIDGSDWEYTNWHTGNPDGAQNDAQALKLWNFSTPRWVDHRIVGEGSNWVKSYIVEWDNNPPAQWKIQDGGNGHWYEAVEDPGILWEDANTTSISMGGYLATPTSAEENQFIYEMIEPIDSMWNSGEWNGPWLGGYQDTNAPDYEEPMGGWRWDTDEVWNFTNWASNQPDDGGAKFTENHLQYWQRDQNTWNDIHTAANVSGFVVEFTTLPGSALGACCLDGLCITTAAADCSGNSGSWGGPDSSCSDFDCPENCPGDLDGNGAVDVTDLLLLMAFWGSCP